MERKTLIVIFVINKKARAQARAKPELSRAEHTHARKYEQNERGHPSRMRSKGARTIGRVSQNTFCFSVLFFCNKQTSAKTQLVSWPTIISISVRSSFILYFCVKTRNKKINHQYMLCLSAKRFSFMKSKPRPPAGRWGLKRQNKPFRCERAQRDKFEPNFHSKFYCQWNFTEFGYNARCIPGRALERLWPTGKRGAGVSISKAT